jgi:hypothetical protein
MKASEPLEERLTYLVASPSRQAAEEVAEAAIGKDSRDAWAMHALAHVHGTILGGSDLVRR